MSVDSNPKIIQFVILEMTALGDVVQFKCNQCEKVLTERLSTHVIGHGAEGYTIDTSALVTNVQEKK